MPFPSIHAGAAGKYISMHALSDGSDERAKSEGERERIGQNLRLGASFASFALCERVRLPSFFFSLSLSLSFSLSLSLSLSRQPFRAIKNSEMGDRVLADSTMLEQCSAGSVDVAHSPGGTRLATASSSSSSIDGVGVVAVYEGGSGSPLWSLSGRFSLPQGASPTKVGDAGHG